MFSEITVDNFQTINSFLIENNIKELVKENFIDNPFMKAFIYKQDNIIIGYLNYSIMYENAELNQIVVDKKYRNKGFGSILMDYFFNECKNCNNISLEVRKNNIPAIKLYEKYEFLPVAIRNNYYGDEDGLLMVCKRGE